MAEVGERDCPHKDRFTSVCSRVEGRVEAVGGRVQHRLSKRKDGSNVMMKTKGTSHSKHFLQQNKMNFTLNNLYLTGPQGPGSVLTHISLFVGRPCKINEWLCSTVIWGSLWSSVLTCCGGQNILLIRLFINCFLENATILQYTLILKHIYQNKCSRLNINQQITTDQTMINDCRYYNNSHVIVYLGWTKKRRGIY